MEALFVQSNASGKPLEATVGNEWTQIRGLLLSVWMWMKNGGDADWCNSPKSTLNMMGVTRATMNLVAHKRLHRIPPEFFSTKSPIPLPPRSKKQVCQGIGDIQQAMGVLCTKQPSAADGYAFLQTRAGAFTFQHYPNSGAVSCPDIETSTFYAIPPTRCPSDFHPFTIQETSYSKTGDFKKVKYASSQVTVPTFGYVMSRGWCAVKSKAELKGLKSEKSIYFDAFCAVCKTPNCGTVQMGTMKTRGGRFPTSTSLTMLLFLFFFLHLLTLTFFLSSFSFLYCFSLEHGMVLMSLFQIAKGMAFNKPSKRLVPFEMALKAASQLLTLRLGKTYNNEPGEAGEQWRDIILPRNKEEAKRAQAIELINLSTIHYVLGEIVESRGDYSSAATYYQLASTTIESAIKPGEALAEFHGVKVNEKRLTCTDHLACMLNSWGLALKRLGKFKDSVKAYKKAISYDPKNATYQSNLMSCQIARKLGLIQNTEHLNGGLKSNITGAATEFSVMCSLPECNVTGAKNKFMLCSRCRNSRYCSPEHQKADWSRHKKDCKTHKKTVKKKKGK